MKSPPDLSFDLLSRYLTMRQMRVLLAVAEQRSVVGAAQELHIAQPAVSRSLGELERALGIALFDRSSRGTTLTVFGEVLLRRVRSIFGELRDAGQELKSLRDGSYGQITVGCTRLLIAGTLPRILTTFMHARPGINFSIIESDTSALIGDLRERNIDIVLGRLPSPANRDIDIEYGSLFDEKLLLVAPPDHPLAKARRLSLAETLREPWVLPLRQSMLFRVIAETFSSRGLPLPSARVEVESPKVMLELVATAGMIALVPRSNLADAAIRHPFAVVSRVNAIEYGPVGYMTLRAKDPTPALSAFVSVLRTEIPQILGSLPTENGIRRRATTRRGRQSN